MADVKSRETSEISEVFQFADLGTGEASAKAFAAMLALFVRQFTKADRLISKTSSMFCTKADALLSSIILRLLELPKDEVWTRKSLEGVKEAMSTRQKAILVVEQQKKLARQKKIWGPQRVINLDASSDSDEDGMEGKPEAKELLEKQEALFNEMCHRERQRELELEANELQLIARARKVDASSFEASLASGKVVVLNEGIKGNGARGGGKKKTAKNTSMPQEEIDALVETLDRTRKEKELFQELVSSSPSELSGRAKALQEEIAALEETVEQKQCSEQPRSSPAMSKGQMCELEGKVSKQTQERNRLLLQLKAIPTSVSEDEEGSEPLTAVVSRLAEMVPRKAALLVRLLRSS